MSPIERLISRLRLAARSCQPPRKKAAENDQVRKLTSRLRLAAQLCRVERRRALEIDWEAYIRRSELDFTPRMPPLTAARVFTDYFLRPGYQKHRDCNRCDRWRKAPKIANSHRPPGTLTREACLGCAVSFLDHLGEELEAIQDRLYQEWVDARETLKDHEAGKRYQETEKDVRRWRNRRKKLQQNISHAERACELSGLQPMKRWRQWTRRQGTFPNEPLDQDMVSAEIIQPDPKNKRHIVAVYDHLTWSDEEAVS